VLVAAAFVLVLAASPLLHHDLACHLKTPTHCHGCWVSPAASLVGVGIVVPPVAGSRLVVIRPASDPREFLEGHRLSGRAPPASSPTV